MNQNIQSYLRQVMRYSGLSKSERAEWVEEMSSHLNDETSRLIQCGYGENEATTIALQNFGEPSKLRKKISRATFGLSAPTIFYLACTGLVLFFIDFYILQLHGPSWYQEYPNTWGYATSILSTIPFSPSLMLGLFISSLALFKTRRRADRLSIVVTLVLFGLIWVLIRLPLSIYANELLFGFKDLTTMEPWVSIIDGVLVVWGLSQYVWTKNRWISLFPTLLSIIIGLWNPILRFVYPSPQDFVTSISLMVLFRCIPLVLLVLTFRVVDRYSIDRKASTVS